MTEQLTRWFEPQILEGVLFDIAMYAGKPGNPEGYEGTEALRRNSFEHDQWVQQRAAGGDWITPLLKVGCIDMSKTSPRTTHIVLMTRNLLVTDYAKHILSPVAGPDTEFLPVDVVDGRSLHWVYAPIVPAALNEEKSNISRQLGKMTSINRAVLNGSEIPDSCGFLSLSQTARTPVMSEAVTKAICENDLFGIGLREIEVI